LPAWTNDELKLILFPFSLKGKLKNGYTQNMLEISHHGKVSPMLFWLIIVHKRKFMSEGLIS
jgi:hypothetical protein